MCIHHDNPDWCERCKANREAYVTKPTDVHRIERLHQTTANTLIGHSIRGKSDLR